MKIKKIILLFLISTILYSCTKDADRYAIDGTKGQSLSGIIKFSTVTSSSVQADSFSVTAITVQLDKNTDSANRVVTFHTSLGKFSNRDSVTTFFVNSNGQAIVNLYSSTIGSALVSASVGTISIDTTIQFTPAFPTDMLLSASKYVADSSDTIRISSQLVRGFGRVSNGAFVYFTTSRNNKADSLIIPSFTVSQSGLANVTMINPFFTHGYFTLTAWTISQSNDTLKKSLNIFIR